VTRRFPTAQQSLESLERVVRERVEDGRSTGIVAGMVFAEEPTEVVACGDGAGGAPLDADSLFEIGSITKLFTGTLLAQMAAGGELRLSDPVAGLLPADVRVPARGDRQITLLDLATHTSGLPSMPVGHVPSDVNNPMADYGVEQLYASLAALELPRDPGARFEYSNLGAGLLGHALARRAGADYEDVVRERILQPLAMTSTAIAMTAQLAPRLVTGHDPRGAVAPSIELPALPGAGALRSSAGDMLRFAKANLGAGDGPLQEAFAAAQAPRAKIQLAMRVGLCWNILGSGRRTILCHDGGTVGFSSSLALRPARRTGVIVLSSSRQSSVADIALHMVEPRLRLAPPPKQRHAIALPSAVLERYAGTYDVEGTTVEVSSTADGLRVHAPGQPVDELLPETQTRFFFTAYDAQVVFKLDVRRRVTGAAVHQDGRRIAARKID